MMPPDFQKALIVLAVGMGTVFLVLSLIVGVGRLLIQLVNRFSNPTKVKTSKSVTTFVGVKKSGTLDPKKIAAIAAAIDIVTHGHAKIEQIQRVD